MNHSLLLKALGWALLHSLWQYGLLWIVFFLITSLYRFSSALKHGIALLLSMAGLVWFFVTFIAGYLQVAQAGSGNAAGFFAAGWLTGNARWFTDHGIVYVTNLYLVVTTLQFAKYFFSFYRSRALYTAGLSKPLVEIRLYVQKMVLQLHIRRQVQVFVSAYVDTPLVIGFLKPTILLPVACINQLTLTQLEAILLHELSHIKRNDYLVNMYMAAMEILFFFNPFARIIFQHIKKEREHSCDDRVIQYRYGPHSYATALLALEQNRNGYLHTGIAATGAGRKILLHRVQRIMQVNQPQTSWLSRIGTCFAALGLLCVVALLQPSLDAEKLVEESRLLQLLAHRLAVPAHRIQPQPRPAGSRSAGSFTIQIRLRKAARKSPSVYNAGPQQPDNFFIPVSARHDVVNPAFRLEAVNTEKRNFSIPDEIQPELPAAALVNTFPFVPSSSFYYLPDTAKPVIKQESYHQRSAKESYLKAKKALSEVDWSTLQKHLPAKVNVAQLRKALEQSIAQVNWQRIDEEVKDSLNTQATRLNRLLLKSEYDEMNNWKNQQQQLEDLHQQLQLRQKNYKLEAEKSAIDLQKQLTKSKIIVYL